MRRLEFNYNDKKKRLELSTINIIAGGSNTGKTSLLNNLVSIFEGKESSAIYNLKNISKGQFNVKVLSSTQTIEDELKMTSKTELLSKTKQAILELDEESQNKIKEDLRYALKPLEHKIKSKINIADTQEFIFDDLLDLVKNYYHFIDVKNYSLADKRFSLMYELLASIDVKETVLFIDDFEAYFDLSQMLSVVDKFITNDNLLVFLFTKSSDFCKMIYDKYPICLTTHNLKELSSIIDAYTHHDIGINEAQLYFTLVTNKEIRQNQSKLIRAYFNEIFQLLISKNNDFLLLEFEKSSLFNEKDKEILRNFKKYINESV